MLKCRLLFVYVVVISASKLSYHVLLEFELASITQRGLPCSKHAKDRSLCTPLCRFRAKTGIFLAT